MQSLNRFLNLIYANEMIDLKIKSKQCKVSKILLISHDDKLPNNEWSG